MAFNSKFLHLRPFPGKFSGYPNMQGKTEIPILHKGFIKLKCSQEEINTIKAQIWLDWLLLF